MEKFSETKRETGTEGHCANSSGRAKIEIKWERKTNEIELGKNQ